MTTIIFIGFSATAIFFYVRLLLKRLEPSALRQAAEAATAYRAAMGRTLDVADAERRIRRMTKANIVIVTTIIPILIVVEVISNL